MDSSKTQASQTFSFSGLGLAPKFLEILDALKISTPTPIQHKAIPSAIEGKDVIGIAQTGTGKTLAFGLPLLQRLAASEGNALILLPTRELALQVDEALSRFARALGLKSVVLIGGASMGRQVADIRRNPDIVIATPGRLIDHLEQRTLNLGGVSILVLDEADRMLDMGFWPQIKKILAVIPRERQTMLFSATLSKEIMELATKHMKTPTSIEVAPPGTTVEKVTQEFFIVRKEQKGALLESMLKKYSGSTLVFSRTKHGAKRLVRSVLAAGHSAAEIHGNRSLAQRREALEGFKKGRYRVLVATDIASRGIDVKGIELVLNYDLPSDSSDYVHRIGRTARAGATGHAISFAEPHQRQELRSIERLIRMPIRVSQTPSDLPASRIPLDRGPRAPRAYGSSPHAPRGRSFHGRTSPRGPFRGTGQYRRSSERR